MHRALDRGSALAYLLVYCNKNKINFLSAIYLLIDFFSSVMVQEKKIMCRVDELNVPQFFLGGGGTVEKYFAKNYLIL